MRLAYVLKMTSNLLSLVSRSQRARHIVEVRRVSAATRYRQNDLMCRLPEGEGEALALRRADD